MVRITAKVTRNGQVTIPKPIREQFQVQEGDMVLFEVEDGRITLRFVDPQPLSAEEAEAIKRGLEQLLQGDSIEYQAGMYRNDTLECSHGDGR